MGTKLRAAGGLLVAGAVVAACDAPSYPAYDRAQMLSEATEMLIIPAYTDAASRATELHTATTALCASPSQTTLDAAQAAWLAAAIAWRATEPYTVAESPAGMSQVPGQVSGNINADITYAADPALIDTAIGGTDDLTASSYVDTLGGPAKGYFALEYLLFGYPSFTTADDAMTLTALGEARRCQYAEALAAHLDRRTAEARDGWSGPNGFGAILSSSSATTTYSGPQGAADAYLSAVATATDAIRDFRLGRPLGRVTRAGHVESPYAGASVALVEATADAVHEAWTGTPHAPDAFLRTRSTELADRVISELDAMRTTIRTLESPPLAMPFEQYVAGTDHAAGNAAYDAVQTLEASLLSDVRTTLGQMINVVMDGD